MIKALAAAKINLYLDVIRRRGDGYHDIETFYQPVSLYDELVFERAASGVALAGDDPAVPWNEENLCHRAARLVIERGGVRGGVRISCRKGIPPGAGLGGGSADAAATLIAVNRLLDARLGREELLELGARLGSDVPFFVLGRPAIGRGRGEILEDVSGLPGGWILIVKPNLSISTKWAYENINLLLTKDIGKATLTTLLAHLHGFPNTALATHNSFEAGVIERFPEVAGVLAALREARPVLSSLSGSGSACFAIFGEEREAREARGRFVGGNCITRIVQPIPEAVKLGQERERF
jgi:4-diphosphocytidyl-2-C-methyl-D-erythritol kinase